ncbi:uncharacterized protein LOC132198010 [Neocloeon triangulifer]|uniref:uncharacterized protein LOC132198010 n=1 Tax=Neocloeon triangulifer TaxID=2078957 RepID=UPI00286FAE23|nr:uncharacterized protein LOC132198010 [Neocloeon triangulifer]XP_059477655.1 uncharacterized protein LOC132198010 [Neocloeon triangulifer]
MASNQCRMCHQKGVIDLKNDRSGEVMKKISSVITFKLEMRPELSSMLCRECYKQISTTYAYQMKCLRHEFQLRKRVKLDNPEVRVDNYSTDINETNTAPMHQLLSDSGLQVLRQNIKQLNDKVAEFKEDKLLMQDKVATLEKERDELKRSVMQYTIALPDITKNIASLLSRMEQQFVAMNTRVIPDNYVETRARSPIVSISIPTKPGGEVTYEIEDQMDIPDFDHDDDEMLMKGTTTIWDPTTQSSNFFTVLVPRRSIS